MFMRRIKLQNLLSFGPDAQELDLKPLNVLIGPNGSGKSNLIEAISLLQAAPRNLPAPVRESGGVESWIWRGRPKAASACIEVVVDGAKARQPLCYRLGFTERNHRFELIEEVIEDQHPSAGHGSSRVHYEFRDSRAVLSYRDSGKEEPSKRSVADVHPEKSILSLRKDPEAFPELTWLGESLGRIRFYREWSFGRAAAGRHYQSADLSNDFLAEAGDNLGLMINRWRSEPEVKKRFLDVLRVLYDGVTDFDVRVIGGAIQVLLQEDGISVPGDRLSDGTLRYLCLLAILCHPNPPPLVCLEQPELGLHPDVVPGLAELLREASERCQLIVTTHSDVVVDKLTDASESVVVCEKIGGQTRLKRLDKDHLSSWLDDHRLGEHRRLGEPGGNRQCA